MSTVVPVIGNIYIYIYVLFRTQRVYQGVVAERGGSRSVLSAMLMGPVVFRIIIAIGTTVFSGTANQDHYQTS